jgi:hypothetical protein
MEGAEAEHLSHAIVAFMPASAQAETGAISALTKLSYAKAEEEAARLTDACLKAEEEVRAAEGRVVALHDELSRASKEMREKRKARTSAVNPLGQLLVAFRYARPHEYDKLYNFVRNKVRGAIVQRLTSALRPGARLDNVEVDRELTATWKPASQYMDSAY